MWWGVLGRGVLLKKGRDFLSGICVDGEMSGIYM